MTAAEYDKAANAAIQAVYDDPALEQLADRLEELLDLLDTDPKDIRLTKRRMQKPRLWMVVVFGSGEEFTFLWDFEGDVPWVRWAALGTI